MQDPRSNAGIINMHELMDIMDHDMDLVRECFNDFLSEWPAIFKEIMEAVQALNAEQLKQAAHKLKGMLKYLCAERAVQAAMDLESAGRKKVMEGLDEKLSLLEQECLNLVQYIKNHS